MDKIIIKNTEKETDMKNAFKFFMLFVFTGICAAALSNCSVDETGFGGTSTTTTTTTTTTVPPHTNTYTFIFKPSSETLHGKTITGVYLSGTMNSWNAASMPMTYNSNSNYYELTTVLNDGTYNYSYRVTYSSTFPFFYSYYDPANNRYVNAKESYSEFWFADKYSSDYVLGGLGGLNSKLVLPYASTNFYNLTGRISNAETCQLLLYVVYNDTWQYIDTFPQTAVVDVDIDMIARDIVLIQAIQTNAVTNTAINNFYLVNIVTPLSADTQIDPADMNYDSSSLQPAYGQTLSNGNIDFYWGLPDNNGTLSNVTLYILQNSDVCDVYLATNLSADCTNFHFAGNAAVTGNTKYRWGLIFLTASGYELYSRCSVVTITNY